MEGFKGGSASFNVSIDSWRAHTRHVTSRYAGRGSSRRKCFLVDGVLYFE